MYSYIRSSEAPHITELYFSTILPEPDLVSSVRVFVFDKKRNLLFVKEKDGNWDIPGGRSEIRETPEETAFREVFEESCVRTKNIQWVAHEKLIAKSEKTEKSSKHLFSVVYIAYAVAEVDVIEGFSANNEAIDRTFLPFSDAIKQDGIRFKNRRIIFDKILNIV